MASWGPRSAQCFICGIYPTSMGSIFEHGDKMRFLYIVNQTYDSVSQNGDGPTSYGHSDMGQMMIPAMWCSGVSHVWAPISFLWWHPRVTQARKRALAVSKAAACGPPPFVSKWTHIWGRVLWDRQDEGILGNLAPGSKWDRLIVWKIYEHVRRMFEVRISCWHQYIG